MVVKTFPVGDIQANCYVIIDESSKKAVMIDPGDNASYLKLKIDELGVNVETILLTHAHFDHVGAVKDLKDAYDCKVYLTKEEEKFIISDSAGLFGKLPKIYDFIQDGDIVSIGDLKIKAISTPGHTKGGICYLVEDKVFTGDTLFQGSVGRSDFPGGNFDELISSIETKLMVLDGNTEVYPGHGFKSTIAYEKANNPFLS